MDNVPRLTKYQESYIELIARKTAKATGDEIEARLSGSIGEIKEKTEDVDKRLQDVEKKVYNGIDLRFKHVNWKIAFLFATYSVMIVIIVKKAFFG